MKSIFVGSSTESLAQAKRVASILSTVENVRPILWTEIFAPGDITFVKIEELASRVAGCVFLASPDDNSVIRQRKTKVPRANVLFEYGYLTAMLTRSRVAICRYADVELPSDFAGLTYIPMGNYEQDADVDHHAAVRLQTWAADLPSLQLGVAPTLLVHGYSGIWHTESTFRTWRKFKIKPPDFAVFRGQLMLHIPLGGENGAGRLTGHLQVKIGSCYAEFQVSDLVTEVRVERDGTIRMRSSMQSRQRILLEGSPPQEDGFEPMLRFAREYDSTASCTPNEPGVMRGYYITRFGEETFSEADDRYSRSTIT